MIPPSAYSPQANQPIDRRPIGPSGRPPRHLRKAGRGRQVGG